MRINLRDDVLITGLVIVMLAGCTTYTPNMTQEERIIARYEQNNFLDPEPRFERKFVKRVFFDVMTLGLAELWYGRSRSAYNELMHGRAEWGGFVSKYTGKNQDAVIMGIGAPDERIPMNDGGVTFVYTSKSWDSYSSKPLARYAGVNMGPSHNHGAEHVSQLIFRFDAGKCVEIVKKNR